VYTVAKPVAEPVAEQGGLEGMSFQASRASALKENRPTLAVLSSITVAFSRFFADI
jgi:hypothetical protein